MQSAKILKIGDFANIKHQNISIFVTERLTPLFPAMLHAIYFLTQWCISKGKSIAWKQISPQCIKVAKKESYSLTIARCIIQNSALNFSLGEHTHFQL